MTKQIKKAISIILTVVLVIGVVPLGTLANINFSKFGLDWLKTDAYAEKLTPTPAQQEITWAFDGNGTLTISGEGKIEGDPFDECEYPWEEYRDKVINLVIEDGITSIGNSAFEGYDNLFSVKIGDGVTEINNYAFSFCKKLKSVYLGKNVKVLGTEMISEEEELDSYTWEQTGCVFEGCPSLTVFNIDEDNPYLSIDEYHVLYNKDKTTLIAFPGGCSRKIYEVPNTVLTIVSGAFSFSNLYKVTIPASVKNIYFDIFVGSNNLVSVEVDKNNSVFTSGNNYNSIVTKAGNELVAGCNNSVIPQGVKEISSEFYYSKGVNNITIPSSVEYIWDGAFLGCSLSSVFIPASVEEIGRYAFGYLDEFDEKTDDYKKVDGFTIYGYPGTAAEEYAIDNDFNFINASGKHIHSLSNFVYNPQTKTHTQTCNGCDKVTTEKCTFVKTLSKFPVFKDDENDHESRIFVEDGEVTYICTKCGGTYSVPLSEDGKSGYKLSNEISSDKYWLSYNLFDDHDADADGGVIFDETTQTFGFYEWESGLCPVGIEYDITGTDLENGQINVGIYYQENFNLNFDYGITEFDDLIEMIEEMNYKIENEYFEDELLEMFKEVLPFDMKYMFTDIDFSYDDFDDFLRIYNKIGGEKLIDIFTTVDFWDIESYLSNYFLSLELLNEPMPDTQWTTVAYYGKENCPHPCTDAYFTCWVPEGAKHLLTPENTTLKVSKDGKYYFYTTPVYESNGWENYEVVGQANVLIPIGGMKLEVFVLESELEVFPPVGHIDENKDGICDICGNPAKVIEDEPTEEPEEKVDFYAFLLSVLRTFIKIFNNFFGIK